MRALDQWHQALVQYVIGGMIGFGDRALSGLVGDPYLVALQHLANRVSRSIDGGL